MARGQSSSRGRGWHGDPRGHAKAGAMGGRARGRKRSNSRGSSSR